VTVSQGDASQDRGNQGFSTFAQAFMRLSLKQRTIKAVRFARGLWVARKLGAKGLIDAGRRIKVVRQNGEIHLNKYCRLGDDVHIAMVGESPDRKAILRIGADSGISDRTRINVTDSVIIGDRCSIGWDCDIADTAWHRILVPGQEPGSISKQVVIEDHVWLGSHTIVLRGVTIGANSVICAGSVVGTNIPPNSLAAGNPARVLQKIEGWDRNPDIRKPELFSDVPLEVLNHSAAVEHTMSDRMTALFRQTFHLPDAFSIHDSMGPGKVPGWDSLGQLQLILAIEQRFDLRLDMDDVLAIETVGSVRELLTRKGVL
jgi:acetyltransferase-like isoleucine patch superfamily enzyme/acyl carrier protein